MTNPDPKSHVPRATRPPRPRRHAVEQELEPVSRPPGFHERWARAQRAAEFSTIARSLDRKIAALLAELELEIGKLDADAAEPEARSVRLLHKTFAEFGLEIGKLDADAAELEARSVRLLHKTFAELGAVKHTIARACDASALLLVRAERVRDDD